MPKRGRIGRDFFALYCCDALVEVVFSGLVLARVDCKVRGGNDLALPCNLSSYHEDK